MNFQPTSAGLDRVKQSLHGAELTLIIPPFVKANRPSYAMHLLQAIALRGGIKTGILYSNLILHSIIGKADYDRLTIGSGLHPLIGDLVFRDLAHPDTEFKRDIATRDAALHKRLAYAVPKSEQQELIHRVRPKLQGWLEIICALIADTQPKIIGLTSTFDQNNASISIINAIKTAMPEIIALIGGANCEGEMAQGIDSLNSKVDYIFSGESDTVLVCCIKTLLAQRPLASKIISSRPVMNLDDTPLVKYDEFYTQFATFVDNHSLADISLPFESSRGCWWGQKHHCTFCGLNGQGMVFRYKDSKKITAELRAMKNSYRVKKIQMVDNIMPMNYFKDLLPELASANLDLEIFYEQKANLDVKRLLALKRAGVTIIQPGIESFSSKLLKRMDKGVMGGQNILLLRNAKSLGISLAWNLLYAFPGDRLEDYEPTQAILSKLIHLQPPVGFFQLSLDRFSMYHKHPENYGVTNLKPLGAYADIYPPWADIEKLAYYFEGDYNSEINNSPELIEALDQSIRQWQQSWSGSAPPEFHLHKLSDKTVILIDSRESPSDPETNLFTIDQAHELAMPNNYCNSKKMDEYIGNGWGLLWEDRYIPLMTMDSELLSAWH